MIEPRKVKNEGEISAFPHDKEYIAFKKDENGKKGSTPYRVVRLATPFIQITPNATIGAVAEKGMYVAQFEEIDETTQQVGAIYIFNNYRDLQKDFYIPRGNSVDVTPDFDSFDTDSIDVAKKYIKRFKQEIKRAKDEQTPFKPIEVETSDLERLGLNPDELSN